MKIQKPAGAHIRTVTNGVYGESFTTAGAAFEKTVKVASAARSFFRVEAYTSDNRLLFFSNCIYFRPDDSGEIDRFKKTLCK